MNAIRLAILLVSLSSSQKIRAEENSWQHLYTQDGIAAYRAAGNAPIPRFKAEGTIEGNLYEVLAVMNDMPRRVEWVENLKEIKLVSGIPEKQFRIYSRLDLPWPLSDRDSLIDASVTIDYSQQDVLIDFHDVTDPAVPVREGIVRVPHTKGLTHMKLVNDTTITVSYEIEFDSGGALPDWVVKMFTQDVPLKTIKALKLQVKKTRGTYDEFVRHHKEMAAASTR